MAPNHCGGVRRSPRKKNDPTTPNTGMRLKKLPATLAGIDRSACRYSQ